jgi:hypothetical protein
VAWGDPVYWLAYAEGGMPTWRVNAKLNVLAELYPTRRVTFGNAFLSDAVCLLPPPFST